MKKTVILALGGVILIAALTSVLFLEETAYNVIFLLLAIVIVLFVALGIVYGKGKRSAERNGIGNKFYNALERILPRWQKNLYGMFGELFNKEFRSDSEDNFFGSSITLLQSSGFFLYKAYNPHTGATVIREWMIPKVFGKEGFFLTPPGNNDSPLYLEIPAFVEGASFPKDAYRLFKSEQDLYMEVCGTPSGTGEYETPSGQTAQAIYYLNNGEAAICPQCFKLTPGLIICIDNVWLRYERITSKKSKKIRR